MGPAYGKIKKEIARKMSEMGLTLEQITEATEPPDEQVMNFSAVFADENI